MRDVDPLMLLSKVVIISKNVVFQCVIVTEWRSYEGYVDIDNIIDEDTFNFEFAILRYLIVNINK